MWIFSRYGFFDAVRQDGVADDELIVKGRVRGHLESLVDFLPGYSVAAIEFAEGRDYPFRLRVKKADFARAVEAMIRDIDYSKYKAAANQRCGNRFHAVLLRVWSVVAGLEDDPSRIRRWLGRAQS